MLRTEVDLWVVDLAECHDPALLRQYEAVLSADERVRWQRFVHELDRHRYLVSRALLREVLGRCLAVSPSAIEFGLGRYGKPHVLGQLAQGEAWSFNLSHTVGMLLLGVTRGAPLGVDVECRHREAPVQVGLEQFSAMEVQALAQAEPPAQAELFWALWTLKESYLKAIGMGLSLPLDQFGLALDVPGRVSLWRHPEVADPVPHWYLAQWHPAASHVASLCLAHAPGTAPLLRMWRTVPWRGQHEVPAVLDRTTASD